MAMNKFSVRCRCGNLTNRAYAKAHGGQCKACVTGVARPQTESNEHRQGRLIDSGWQGYVREEGHYDIPGE